MGVAARGAPGHLWVPADAGEVLGHEAEFCGCCGAALCDGRVPGVDGVCVRLAPRGE